MWQMGPRDGKKISGWKRELVGLLIGLLWGMRERKE